MQPYKTDFRRTAMGFLAGAAVGYTIIIVPISLSPNGLGEGAQVFGNLFGAAVTWLIILSIFGLPTWLVLHIFGCRQWYVAVAAGTLIPNLVLLMVTGSQTNAVGALPFAVFGGFGAVVAWVIWRVAYRKADMTEDG